jgi:hypothetical protein
MTFLGVLKTKILSYPLTMQMAGMYMCHTRPYDDAWPALPHSKNPTLAAYDEIQAAMLHFHLPTDCNKFVSRFLVD